MGCGEHYPLLEVAMKKLVLITILICFTSVGAQTHFCITTVDQCCDGTGSSNSDTTVAFEQNWILYYDAGDAANHMEIRLMIDGSLLNTWNVCGCGEVNYSYATNAGHIFKLSALCNQCGLESCVSAQSKAVFTSATSGNPCKRSCQ